jgi:hypothetical protein
MDHGVRYARLGVRRVEGFVSRGRRSLSPAGGVCKCLLGGYAPMDEVQAGTRPMSVSDAFFVGVAVENPASAATSDMSARSSRGAAPS